MTGVSDVHNFGDALFPLIAAHRLAPYGISVTPASPTGAPLSWTDALPSLAIEKLLVGREPSDGLLLGGGHIIMCGFRDSMFDTALGRYDSSAVSLLWLGASLAAALRDVPVAWNAPGVYGPFIGDDLKATVGAAVQFAGYACVRDDESRAHLGQLHGRNVEVVPDTAFGVADLWPRSDLELVYRELLARKSVAAPSRVLAVHIRGKDQRNVSAAEIAARIDAFSNAQGLTPLLVAVGPGVEDDETARGIAARLTTPHILLDDPHSLKEIAAALAMADVYVGESLHGYVVGAAYGVPGVLLAKAPGRRLRGVLKQIDRPQDLARTLAEALDAASDRLRTSTARGRPPATAAALDRHWASVASVFHERSNERSAERLSLLNAYVRLGLNRGKEPWLLQPFAARDVPFGRGAVQPVPEIADG